MMTEEEKNEILEEIKQYPHPSVGSIDALKIIQKHHGWVSDESLHEIAEILNMSDTELESIATFYSRIYRKPVGRNVILVCDGISCMVMGYGTIYEYLATRLGIKFGETTPDNRFTLLPISCLGDCDHAPAMMINDEHYNDLTADKIDILLGNYK